MAHHARTSRPALLRGAACGLPVFDRWSDLHHLRRVAGDALVEPMVRSVVARFLTIRFFPSSDFYLYIVADELHT